MRNIKYLAAVTLSLLFTTIDVICMDTPQKALNPNPHLKTPYYITKAEQKLDEGIILTTLNTPNGPITCQLDLWDEKTVTVFKNNKEISTFTSPLEYPHISKILCNKPRLVLSDCYDKCTLFDYENKSTVFSDADSILFNPSETICMVKKGSDLIVTQNNQPFIAIEQVREATLSPNGTLLFVLNNNTPAQLISVENQQVLCSIKNVGINTAKSAQFSSNEQYMLLEYPVPHRSNYTIYDVNSGKICLNLQNWASDTEVYFYQKYFVAIDADKTAYLISLDDLPKIAPNRTFDQITELDITKRFANVAKHTNDSFKKDYRRNPQLNEIDRLRRIHPNGKFIVTLDEKRTWELKDIESGKTLITHHDVAQHYFNEPDGDVVTIEFKKHLNPVIFSLNEVLPDYYSSH